MGSRGVETGFVSVPLDDDRGAVGGGVGRLSLGGLGFLVLLAGVLQLTLLLDGDTVAGFETENKVG